RGNLLCPGHVGSHLGFAEVDAKGRWKGFDIGLCKALTTAIFGTDEKLEIVPLSWAQRFPALQSEQVDVIIKLTGWTMSRDTKVGLQFSRPYLLGTTQMMVPKSLKIKSGLELDGASICTVGGSTNERFVATYFNANKLKHELITFEKYEEMNAAYFSGRCDVFVAWGPSLAVARAGSKNPDDHMILPDILAMEPESAAMRQGDEAWVDLVNWMFSALLTAELEGVTRANVDAMKADPPTVVVSRLLGVTPGIGERLGLRETWAYDMIKAHGNYGEIFDREIGKNSPYGLSRGLNALFKDGGALYPLVLD
ncbi:MAG: ABC transporter substrate-binding protein, partial [Rhodospirillaceae bacterium]|nr:ABC transporter substrate-binding protein [Rhodospirillaceae bacterium]